MAKILFYDLETNSLDTERGFIQEIAYAVFDTETKRCIKSQSHLLAWGMGYVVDPNALAVTNLSREYCEKNGEVASTVLSDFVTLIKTCQVDYIAGHNILQFDNLMLKSNVLRSMFEEFNINEYKCLDTYLDLEYPAFIKNYTLKYLALEHGYVLSGAHEAMNDVFACAHIFFQYPVDKTLAKAKDRIVLLSAYTAYTDTESREQLNALKFKWNRVTKRWEKRVRESQVESVRKIFSGPFFVDDVLFDNAKNEQLELPF